MIGIVVRRWAESCQDVRDCVSTRCIRLLHACLETPWVFLRTSNAEACQKMFWKLHLSGAARSPRWDESEGPQLFLPGSRHLA
mmetsp:Transcript_5362/g.14965  ORF Transcript_5362/g.14965 Transcript_5362/m.14965 type:complete len:83 (+) Transcript_5362:850-1098(+)